MMLPLPAATTSLTALLDTRTRTRLPWLRDCSVDPCSVSAGVFSVTNRNVTDYNRTSLLTRGGDIVITSGEKRSLTTSIPTMDSEVTAVLEAYKAFRDRTNEDAYLKIQEKNPGLEALFDALMDLEQASED